MSRLTATCLSFAACAVGLVFQNASCSTDSLIAPVLDVPELGSAASPFPDIDELELVVNRGNPGTVLAVKSFRRGQTVELGGVPFGDNLVLQVTGRIRGTEVAYGRSCEFSFGPQDATATPHIFFSRTKLWSSQSGSVTTDRTGGVAAADRDGRVVFAGGSNSAGGFVARLELFDPRQGEFRTLGELAPRLSPSLLALGNGQLVFGGGSEPTTGAPLGFFETIDTTAPATSQIGRLNDEVKLSLRGSAFSALGDGRIAVFGGSTAASNMPVAKVLLLSAESDSIRVREVRAVLETPRTRHTATALSDDPSGLVLLAGGVDSAGVAIASAELFKTGREQFAIVAPALMRMNVPRSDHRTIRFGDGSALILGGVDASGLPVRSIELFTFDQGFTEVGMLPAGTGVLGISVNRLPDGRVLIVGGKESISGPLLNTAVSASLDLPDATFNVVQLAPMTTPRAFHQGALLCDGTVLLTGGTIAPAAAERYNPPILGR